MLPMITRSELHDLVAKLGQSIRRDYIDLNDCLTVLWIYQGAKVFSTDLVRQMRLKRVRETCIRASSYAGTESTGKMVLDPAYLDVLAIKNRHVLVVEDLLDTGLTLSRVQDYVLNDLGAADVKTCVLLWKPSRQVYPIEPDYVGQRIPDRFVVGYGLDYKDRFRDLRYIGILGDREKEDVDREEAGLSALPREPKLKKGRHRLRRF
jgi:hypoxanthine phosphoribosyltransferase